MNKLQRILLFLKLPPPLTGATIMNQAVSQSIILHSSFHIKLLSFSYKHFIEETTAFSFKKIKTILVLYFSLIKSLINFKPQIVYFQISPIGIAFFRDCTYVLIMKLFGTHILYHLHGKGIQEYIGGSIIKTKIYSWAFRNSSVICLSDKLTYDLHKFYKDKPFIVNNGILSFLNVPINRKPSGIISILFFSNIIISKGVYDYIEAISILNNQHPELNFHASIAGNPTELTNYMLQEEIKLKNIQERLTYLGPKYDNEKIELLGSSDILVYPTFNDVWGLVILEAMQSGLPVIATREGAIPEIVDDGITGFLVDKHRPDQIADKLEILINDPILRNKMGEAARNKFLEKYSLEIFEKNMVAVFQDVLRKVDLSV